MKKHLTAIVLLAITIPAASAVTLIEDFEDPFPAWESGWFGTNSNAVNYYGVGAGRGNNPDGLWITPTEVLFDPVFGAALTSLSFDATTYVDGKTVEIFDSAGVTLLSAPFPATDGAFTDPGDYLNFSTSSTTGIGGFRFIPSGAIEGNTSIDNIIVNHGPTNNVPDGGTTAALMGLALFGLGAVRRKLK